MGVMQDTSPLEDFVNEGVTHVESTANLRRRAHEDIDREGVGGGRLPTMNGKISVNISHKQG